MMEDETFEIITRNKVRYEVTQHFTDTGNAYYTVEINEINVNFIHNTEWATEGPVIVPDDPDAELDISELQDIAEAIERYTI